LKRNAHHLDLTWQAHKVENDWGLFLGTIRAELSPLGRLSVFSLLQVQVNSPSGPSPSSPIRRAITLEESQVSFGIAWCVAVVPGSIYSTSADVRLRVRRVRRWALTGRLSNRLRSSCARRLDGFTIGHGLLRSTLVILQLVTVFRRATSGCQMQTGTPWCSDRDSYTRPAVKSGFLFCHVLVHVSAR